MSQVFHLTVVLTQPEDEVVLVDFVLSLRASYGSR